MRALLVLLALVVFAPQVTAQTYTFEAFAGSTGGAGAVDATTTNARISAPQGLAVDISGNVYFVENASGSMRVVSATGIVTTLVRHDTGGLYEGRRSEVRLNNPRHMVLDAAGVLYVAEAGLHVIRKVTPGGMVTTFAGVPYAAETADGTLTTAKFNLPAGIAIDPSTGDFYVSDQNSHTIRKITPAGDVTTFAGQLGVPGNDNGTGSGAQFNRPHGLAVDASSNVYVADRVNHVIRKITPAGVVTTFAGIMGQQGSENGTGTTGVRFRDPIGLAIDTAGNLYVADSSNHKIRKITTPGAVVTTFAGTGNPQHVDGNTLTAAFRFPSAVAVDGSGNVFVADNGNDAIRKIVPAGPVTTLAGLGVQRGVNDGFGTAARFNEPWGGVVDAAGYIYVSDQGNHTIRKINPTNAQVTTFAGTAGFTGSAPGGVGVGRLYLPRGLSLDDAGNLYVADNGTHTIRKVTASGVISTVAGDDFTSGTADLPGTSAQFNFPSATAIDSAGNIYIADTGNHSIRKITFSGGIANVSTFAGLSGTPGAVNHTGTNARFDMPLGLAIDASDNLYVADYGNHVIRKITNAGVVTTFAGEFGAVGVADATGADARFYFPETIAIGPTGDLYVSDTAKTIRKITVPGADVTTIAGVKQSRGSEDGTGPFARFFDISGIAFNATGTMYVVDMGLSSVRRGTPALAAAATIDSATGALYEVRQLGTTPNPGSSWQWSVVRRPTGSAANLSSPTIANPTFTPDFADVFTFRLVTTDGPVKSITDVNLNVSCNPYTMLPAELPHPINGNPYSENILAGGGTGTGRTYSLSSGTLPPGLSLSSGGTISGTPVTNGTYAFTVRVSDNWACYGDKAYSVTVAPIAAPNPMYARGTSTTNVDVTWTAVSGAAGYRIFRRAYGESGFSEVGTSETNSYADGSVDPSTVYAYRVRAYTASMVETGDSPLDFAHTMPEFLIVEGGVIYASHLTSIRTVLTMQRALAGMTTPNYTDPNLAGVVIKAIHVEELRSRFNAMRAFMGRAGQSFTDPSLAGLPVKAYHFDQIRGFLR